MLQLARVAWADGVVTTNERRDIRKVATLLGLSSNKLDMLLDRASKSFSQNAGQPVATHEYRPTEQLSGIRVCFTGECQCRHLGETITRKMATDLATNHGMIVVESVTKKLDLLVVADPLSQSGKAKKARKYGIRIMHEVVFWNVLRIEVE
jgi:DNA polymerase-3 subunit epsilon